MTVTPEKLSEHVNQSGFPLQIGLSNIVSRTQEHHGWKVLYSEHAWCNENAGTSGFVDLVLENRYDTSVLVVECKRVLHSSWIFLQPGEKITNRRHAKGWVTRSLGQNFTWFDWRDLALDPATAESQYCVVPGQDPKSKPMLERTASDVVDATEAIAWEEKPLQMQQRESLRMYFSMIATTAQLKVGVFDADKVSLKDGTLPDAEYFDVPYLRFRKQLSTRSPTVTERGWNLKGALKEAKERTVFIVNAEALLQFLSEFDIDNEPLRRII